MAQPRPPAPDGSTHPADNYRVWRPQGVSGVEAAMGRGLPRPLPAHFHEDYELSLFIGPPGTEQVRHRGGVHVSTPTGLFLMPPGEVHATDVRNEQPVVARILLCSPATVASIVEDMVDGGGTPLPDFPSIALDGAGLSESFLALHRTLEQHAEPLERESRLVAFWSGVIQRHADTALSLPRLGREREAIRKVQRYMREDLSRRISLSELAGVARMSRFHFCRVFLREVGMTPAAYHAQLRVLRARELLARGEPIVDVALEIGLADQSHLNRIFMKVMGITPGRYAKSVRGESAALPTPRRPEPPPP